MTAPALPSRPPGRAVLRLAGGLSQLVCAGCLLLGTIAFVLVQQAQTGDAGAVIAWSIAALLGLIAAGLMGRGGLPPLLIAAAIDLVFGIVLLAISWDDLRALLRVLPESDVDAIADLVTVIGILGVVVAALCLAAIPQSRRYLRWVRADLEVAIAASTAPGFPPPPISAVRGSVWNLPLAPEEMRPRRRMYFALAGFAVGFGAGVGVLVSSSESPAAVTAPAAGSAPAQAPATAPSTGSAAPAALDPGRPGAATPAAAGAGASGAAATTAAPTTTADDDADVGSAAAGGSGSAAATAAGSGSAAAAMPETAPRPPEATPPRAPDPIASLIRAQRTALAAGDTRAIARLLAPTVFGFGVDATSVAEGRDAVELQLRKDLGDLAAPSTTVDIRFQATGEAHRHAWIALELELSGPNRATRRFAVTELAAWLDNAWTIVAWHWAVPVPDATAERMAILGTKPAPRPIADSLDGPPELGGAVRAAFYSRAGFAVSRSEHERGFNFGSGPNERIVGGAAIKRVFIKLRADIKLRDGVKIVASGAWDPSTRAAPRIAFAAANVDFTAATRAATQLTQTFRVLAVVIREDAGWKLVQTQWSHGGPVR